ncbi:MAG: hypothetical protein AAGD00_08195 [Planctomycetota bacterium]
MNTPAAITTQAEPALGAWAELVCAGARSPRIVVGHQPGLWHPGVLAKYFAAHALAQATGGNVTHLVADQDTGDPLSIDVPVRGAPDNPWSLRVEQLRFGDAPDPETPLCRAPPVEADRVRDEYGIAETLRASVRADSLAEQVTRANASLLGGLLPSAESLFASQLAQTDRFREMVSRLFEDAPRAHESYNRAVRAHPDARMRPLGRDDARGLELPLWHVDSRGRRAPLFSTDERPADVLPRAVLLSAFVRAHCCDVSIVGTGGAQYEPIAEAWLGDWLAYDLAPAFVVSADVRLDLVPRLETPASAATSAWRAHRARHDPSLVGDHARAARKAELLARLKQADDRAERSRLYRVMHGLLDEYRLAHADELARFTREADDARGRVDGSRIASRRDWAWPLYPHGQIERLRDEIRSAISPPTA